MLTKPTTTQPGASVSQVSLWQAVKDSSHALQPPQSSFRGVVRRSFSPRVRRPFERFFTIREVAWMLSYSEKQIRRFCAEGKLQAVKPSARGQYRIGLSALRRWAEKNPEYWAANADVQLSQVLFSEPAPLKDELEPR